MRSTAVLEVSGVQWATSKNVAEVVLSRRPGVLGVEANPVAQTATVIYDPSRTSVAELAGWVRDCGYHCAGQSVPEHICDPLAEPPAAAVYMRDHPQTTSQAHTDHGSGHIRGHTDHDSHDHVITDAPTEPSPRRPVPDADHVAHSPVTPHDAMGHGGRHAGMSMDAMVRDMRNRFVVAALLSVPILLWSPIGREVIGSVDAERFQANAAGRGMADPAKFAALSARHLAEAIGSQVIGASRRRRRRSRPSRRSPEP